MARSRSYCYRAMLLDDGEIAPSGTRGGAQALPAAELRRSAGAARRASARRRRRRTPRRRRWIEDAAGRARSATSSRATPIRPAGRDRGAARHPRLASASSIKNADGVEVSGFGTHLDDGRRSPDRCAAGERVTGRAQRSRTARAGRYFVDCWICRNRSSPTSSSASRDASTSSSTAARRRGRPAPAASVDADDRAGAGDGR